MCAHEQPATSHNAETARTTRENDMRQSAESLLLITTLQQFDDGANAGMLAEKTGESVKNTRTIANKLVEDGLILETADKIDGKKGWTSKPVIDDDESKKGNEEDATTETPAPAPAPVADDTAKPQRTATTKDAYKIIQAAFEGEDAIIEAIDAMPERIRHGAIKKAITKGDGPLSKHLYQLLAKYPKPTSARAGARGNRGLYVVNKKGRVQMGFKEGFTAPGDFLRHEYTEVDGKEVCIIHSVPRADVTADAYSAPPPKEG